MPEVDGPAHERGQLRQRPLRGRVAVSSGGVRMGFQKKAVCTCHGRTHEERPNRLAASATRSPLALPRLLYGMRGVEDDRRAGRGAEASEIAEVDDEIPVTEKRAALGHRDFGRARPPNFF